MKSIEIRKKFFDFFTKNSHIQIDSSSLIPAQDPTLLFTNAGMNQFKDLFLGKESRTYKRAVSIQKCVRAGGKHNDLDNVGFTKRHLTFFEMMGNFSFGNYFKKEAIQFAWELLTQEYKLDKNNLFVSIFKNDEESFNIWHHVIGLPKERIYRFDEKDNFWQMGDTGPCGPCTEIYFDIRPLNERTHLPTQHDFDTGTLLEIWNNVFMQYDRQSDGTLIPLKQTGVDTGMGLERITCVLQKVDSVYQTDLFTALINETEKLTNRIYAQEPDIIKAAFHVLADHVRSTTLLIADGCTPSNDGRGYVLRKIIRRAALFSQKLTTELIIPRLAEVFINEMNIFYPELLINKSIIISLLTYEINQFSNNLIRGQDLINLYFSNPEIKASQIISGEHAFKLYDTYGFPLEITIIMAQERGFSVDIVEFENCMQRQKHISGKKMKHLENTIIIDNTIKTNFIGYTALQIESTVQAIIVNDQSTETIIAGEECWIIPKETPFFPATGGQVDDQGTITINNHSIQILELKKINNAIAIRIISPTDIILGTKIDQQVNSFIRHNTMNNHTATHLLQSALIELFGKQIKQSGSLVTPNYLRFDFTHHKNLTSEEIIHIENRVNEKIRENIQVNIFETTYKKAIDHGVIAIFGEKYNPESVRVIDIGQFSSELCGGTHVSSTGMIGLFKITESTALSAGNKRIFAITGYDAIKLMQNNFNTIKTLSQKFKVQHENVIEAIDKLSQEHTQTMLEYKKTRKELITLKINQDWFHQITLIKNIHTLLLQVNGYTNDEIKYIAEHLAQKQPGLYVILTTNNSVSFLYAFCSKEYQQNCDMEQLAIWIKNHTSIKCGYKLHTIQGGSNQPINQEIINKLLNTLEKIIIE